VGRTARASNMPPRWFKKSRPVGTDEARILKYYECQYCTNRIEILATVGPKLSQQMQDTCSYRYGLLNIGGRDKEEILEIFDYCKRRLTFLFEPA
jgi:hypothetical protein